MSQQYSLRWNNHQPNFISMFTTLLNTQTLVDVTLAAEGQQLRAHKVVLSACSTYFHSLFVDNPSSHPIVILKDVKFSDLRTMVDFMYCGVVNVTEEQLPQVLDTAKVLKIKGLTEMPESTSLTRSQGSSADMQAAADHEQRHSASPATSTSSKRKRTRRKSSSGSACINAMEDTRNDEAVQSVDFMREEQITLSTLPQRQRMDGMQQTAEQQNMNMDHLGMDNNHSGLVQAGQWSMMEHAYQGYAPNACLQLEPPMYMNNAAPLHMKSELSEYGGGCGGSPGPSCGANGGGSPTQPKRRRTTNPQAEQKFQHALEAVRTGGIGFCKAARLYGVNNRTLWLEYKKKGYPNNRPSIKSRIKREHASPPPEHKEPEPQLACAPPVPFAEPPRALDFPLQPAITHVPPLNILNYNPMQ